MDGAVGEEAREGLTIGSRRCNATRMKKKPAKKEDAAKALARIRAKTRERVRRHRAKKAAKK